MTQSIWRRDGLFFSTLKGDREVDVAVLGGGIAGITTAALLKASGRSVVVLERDAVGSGETGRSTAHLTFVLDERYHSLIARFGEEAAGEIARSHQAAIRRIESLVSDRGIQCGFERVPGFLFSEDDFEEIEREDAAMRSLGLESTLTREVPLPFPTKGALRVGDQAMIDPLKYVLGLALTLGEDVCEDTYVSEIRGKGPFEVVTAKGIVRAAHVVDCTHAPGLLSLVPHLTTQMKLHPDRSYAVVARTSARVGRALFWDTADPYHYIRPVGESSYLIGGADHRVGRSEDCPDPFGALEAYAERFGSPTIEARWSGQILEPYDGLAMIGRVGDGLHVATGFSGNGMTYGTLAGMLMVDELDGNENAWRTLYRPDRLTLSKTFDLMKEGGHFLRSFVGGRARAYSTHEMPPVGEGRVLVLEGKPQAVYRKDEKTALVTTPVCPHMGAYLEWNAVEKSWDCPAHGSRFANDGKLLNNPATKRLGCRTVHLAQKECSYPNAPDSDSSKVKTKRPG